MNGIGVAMEFSRGANGGFRPSEVGGGTKGGRFRPIPRAHLSITGRSTELKRANWRRDCCRSARRSPVFSVIRDAFALRNPFQRLATCISCATLAYYLRAAPPIFAVKFNIYTYIYISIKYIRIRKYVISPFVNPFDI